MKKVKFLSSIVQIALVSTMLTMVLGGSPLLFAGLLLSLGFVKYFIAKGFSLPTNLAYDLVISDTTYAGEAAASMIVKAMTSNETVQGGHVYVQDGIKKQFVIPRFDANYEDLIQDRQATPVSAGDLTVSGKALNPADYMIYNEFNPRDFETHWQAVNLNPTLVDRSLPVTLESVIAQEILKRHDRYINKMMWNGNTLSASTSKYKYFDGFIRKAFAASFGSDQTNFPASPTTLTNSNIVTELAKGYAMIPVALKYSGRVKIFCSYATYDLYTQYQQNQTNKGIDITVLGVKAYNGIPLVPIPEFPDNTYIIGDGNASMASNFWVGMNSMDDENKIKIMPVSNPSENWFFKMNCKVDVQIGWNSETVYYGGTPATP